MRALLLLLLYASGVALRAEEESPLVDVGDSETAFLSRFNDGVGGVRFVAIVSPG